jgi:hypothetical protein
MPLPVADINNAARPQEPAMPREALDGTKRKGIPATESGLDVTQGYPIVGCVPVECSDLLP